MPKGFERRVDSNAVVRDEAVMRVHWANDVPVRIKAPYPSS
jgi:hypothetical protein